MNMGKVAVMTGENHGIGAAIAKELAFTGYDVVITWLNPNKYAYSHIDQTRMYHAMGGGDEADRILRETVSSSTWLRVDCARASIPAERSIPVTSWAPQRANSMAISPVPVQTSRILSPGRKPDRLNSLCLQERSRLKLNR
jgi:hypothetical protein